MSRYVRRLSMSDAKKTDNLTLIPYSREAVKLLCWDVRDGSLRSSQFVYTDGKWIYRAMSKF